MSFGQSAVCSSCKTDESDVWEKKDSGDILCYKCCESQDDAVSGPLPGYRPATPSIDHSVPVSEKASSKEIRPKSLNSQTSRPNARDLIDAKSWTRKSNRIKPLKNRSQASTKAQTTKGRSRRVVFKKKVISLAINSFSSGSAVIRARYYTSAELTAVLLANLRLAILYWM